MLLDQLKHESSNSDRLDKAITRPTVTETLAVGLNSSSKIMSAVSILRQVRKVDNNNNNKIIERRAVK